MNLIFFTKYTRVGASSRYRKYQYVPSLELSGAHVTISPLFGDAYLAYKYSHGRARIRDVILAFVCRVWAILKVSHDSVVVIEKELIPYFPALFERWLVWRGIKIVVDFDDALFHQYDIHPKKWVRRFLRNKIATVMRLAHTVTAGNKYLADYALHAGASKVRIIPTVIDLARYPARIEKGEADVINIGWIGSPSTSQYLRDIVPALARVCEGGRSILKTVGSGPVELPDVALVVIPWTEETEVEEINSFDIGIMPLRDEPWERGKCGFKLIQYMACGLPVVASPVGVNATIVEHGVNGFLATSICEWEQALRTLAADPALRMRMGLAGRAKVQTEFSLNITAPQFAGWLHETASGKGA